MSDNTYVTARGVKIEFLPIPRAIQKFQMSHSQPEPPQYEIKTATGIVEKHPHNETTLETDADKAAWAEYQKQLSDFNEKFLRICFVRGVRVHADMNEWIAEQKALDIPVAEDVTERKVEWITDWVLATREDYQQVLLGVMRASEVPEDLLKQIEGLFRGQVGQSNGNGTSETPIPDDKSDVVLQQTFRGSTDGVRPGDTAEPIRPMGRKRQGIRHPSKTVQVDNEKLGTNRSG